MNKKPNVGGQAVIEGVMMRGKTHVAVAVRQPDGEINVDVRPVNSIADRYPILKKPFLRGVVSLVESLVMGMKALSYSAQVSGEEDEKLDSKDMALTIAVSAGLAILLFIIIPYGTEFSGRRFAHGDFPCLYCRNFFDARYSARVSVPRCRTQNHLHLRSRAAAES